MILMNNKNLIDFYKYVKEYDKDNGVYEYEDQEGNYSLVNASALLCVCRYIEADEKEYKNGLFNGTIEDQEYNKIKVTRQVPKNTITHNDKDKYTIVDKEVEASQIWVVSNGIGIKKSYTNKDEALKFVKEINSKYYLVKGN